MNNKHNNAATLVTPPISRQTGHHITQPTPSPNNHGLQGATQRDARCCDTLRTLYAISTNHDIPHNTTRLSKTQRNATQPCTAQPNTTHSIKAHTQLPQRQSTMNFFLRAPCSRCLPCFKILAFELRKSPSLLPPLPPPLVLVVVVVVGRSSVVVARRRRLSSSSSSFVVDVRRCFLIDRFERMGVTVSE